MKNDIKKIGKEVVELQIKALERLKNSINNSFDETATDNLEELLAELDVGYENRLKAFRSMKH